MLILNIIGKQFSFFHQIIILLDIKKPALCRNFYFTPFEQFKMVPGAGLEPARFVGGGF